MSEQGAVSSRNTPVRTSVTARCISCAGMYAFCNVMLTASGCPPLRHTSSEQHLDARQVQVLRCRALSLEGAVLPRRRVS